MPASDSPAIIVARFLKSNNYELTLDAFIQEAGLPPDAGSVEKGDLTIETILEEKKIYDLSVSYEKLATAHAPSHALTVSLPTTSNLLHVSVENVSTPRDSQLLIATTADRRLNFLTSHLELKHDYSTSTLQDSPILSCLVLPSSNGKLITITTGMSGQILLYDHDSNQVLDDRRDHNKYVVKATYYIERKVLDSDGNPTTWLATAGWDAKVLLYRLSQNSGGDFISVNAPVASISLPTNPESALIFQHPDHPEPLLLITRRDSTSLYYYALPSATCSNATLLGTQNLAPHSTAWTTFSPSSIALSPTDPTLLAVATSSVPSLKVLLVRLLLPTNHPAASSHHATQAAQTRAQLATKDREEAAILIHASTQAPQTPYSTPQVVWRPDGSGVWVNGDDGVVRGVEARTGKVVETLKGGHENGVKIRTLWAGLVRFGEGEEEWVVSGGFDKRLVVWKVRKTQVDHDD